MDTWILCPNLHGARLFRFRNAEEGPKFIREYPHPKLHVQREDFDDDDDLAELTLDPNELEAEKKVADGFSTYLARQLETDLAERRFETLIICAEAHLLKILEAKLNPSVKQRLLGTVDVDLYDVNESDLISYVQDLVSRRASA